MKRPPNTAEAYFLQQQVLCRKLLHAYNTEKNHENLHQLRVSIKKIEALLKLLNTLQPEFKFSKSFSPYKNIFKHLAPIREELLQSEKLKTDPGKKPAKNKRSVLVTEMNKELKIATSGYLNDIGKVAPDILKCLAKLKHKDILPYCQKLLKSLKKQWKDIETDAQLHKYRKQLKQLLYCSKLLTRQEKSKLAPAKLLKQIDQLQDIIGQWHDNVLLLNRISEDDLKVSSQFHHQLKNETKSLDKKARKKGDKLYHV